MTTYLPRSSPGGSRFWVGAALVAAGVARGSLCARVVVALSQLRCDEKGEFRSPLPGSWWYPITRVKSGAASSSSSVGAWLVVA